jgi:RimJ/RimL family protein N-acetyltransferase
VRRVTTENQAYLKKWLDESLSTKFPENMTCIGQEMAGEIVGVVGFSDFTPTSCYMHTSSIDPLWITKDLLWASFDYPFNILKVKVILATVAGNNKESLRLCRKLGFVDRVLIEDAHKDGDLAILTMRKEQCKWLDIDAPLRKIKGA